MTEAHRRKKQQAADFFAAHAVTEKEETLMALLLGGVKAANVMILARTELLPLHWKAYRHLHGQLFTDSELYSLLSRATRWVCQPDLYLKAVALNLNLWSKANLSAYLSGFFEKDRKFFRYLALSHAFQSEVRLISLLPPALPLDTPFLETLHEIEIQNGREIQTQIALFTGLEVPGMTLKEKEEEVARQRETVAGHFCDFLDLMMLPG